jgi:hypothetical protein
MKPGDWGGLAALYTCCSVNIAGTQWLEDYKMELTEDYKKEVVGPIKSKRVFIFGDGGQRRS